MRSLPMCSLLVCTSLALATGCGDNVTEPVADRTTTAAVPVSFATTTTEDGLSISTDKDDYAPGDTVHLTGSGWPSRDLLKIVLDDGADIHRWAVEVGADGTFHDSTYVVDIGDLGVTFTLTAMSSTTGQTLVVQFTDNQNPVLTQVQVFEADCSTPLAPAPNHAVCAKTTVTDQGGATAADFYFQWVKPGGTVARLTRSTTAKTNDVVTDILPAAAVTTTGTWSVRNCKGNTPTSGSNDVKTVPCVGGNLLNAVTSFVISNNQAPLVDAGGPYSGNRNTDIALDGATATDADNDALTYSWTYVAVTGVPAGTTCSFNTASDLNPKFKCTNVGTFKVTLSVDDGHGHVVTDDAEVKVFNSAPTANAGPDYTGIEGSAVTLNGSATDPDGDPLTYKWTYAAEASVDAGATCSFDDDTKKDAKVTCTDDGAFKLTLTVKDSDNESGTDVADLVLSNANPTADARGPYNGNEGSAIQLSGSGDDPGDNDNAHLTYKWTVTTTGIDLGGTCSFDDDTNKDAKVTCTDDSNGGHFILSLVVKDDDGGTSVASTSNLAVSNVVPTADAGGPYSGEEGSAILLGGSGNDAGDNDDAHLTYKWTVNTTGIDGSGTCTFDDATKKDATVTCTDDSGNATGGHFTVSLVVKDDDAGSSVSSSANLTVTNAGPLADAGPDYTGTEGSPVQLQGSVTDAGSNDTHIWAWKYVAGAGVDAGATCTFSPDATAEDPTITCTDDGTVELTLKVTDDDGAESTDAATLTLTNVKPVADAGGPYTGNEGAQIPLNGTTTDAGSNDTHTWKWEYVAGDGFATGATCSFTSTTAEDPSITCTDDGTVQLTFTAKDDDGGEGSDGATLTLQNVAPVAAAGGPYSGTEGTAVQLDGSATDAGAHDVLSYKWTVTTTGIDVGGACTFDDATKKDAKVTCTDDSGAGTFTLSLVATDDDGGISVPNTANLTVGNIAPILGAITAPVDPVNISSAVNVSANFTDVGTNDTHTGVIDWGDGSSAATISETNGSGSASGSHTYTAAGVYTIKMTVTDDDGAPSNESIFQYVVVYDPSAGFIAGGGWITSPSGAYPADPNLVGKANFGFVSKYIKDKTSSLPTGNTEFQFHSASLNFKSTSYEWLVVQGSTKASYKGDGTVNGSGNYGFLLSVYDGGSSGDRFRIKIWNKATGIVVYDNQLSAADDATASQVIAGGSIVIHTNGGVANR